ncbi:5-(carboxyamino)imidazole ribonucleotide synthase [Sphingomonas sp. LY29]|uniref:5-(carboxyamino)imidazole ribonucleotide synthase n=1 Tax=Sphingomonas sp. LY29 TaxID=3095341 RepID=UPI002D7953A0|nr:5-(carboxyamino)imidazole ribonucleotide synthase [Sphingomonas sp. LY29]WRP25110.1 5-(carboxyamino)imidazole ribonucleotide synthase [Sphingomonas sp. LY29]
MTVPPGSTIGIVGGGQLGRMMAVAAARLGYRCHVFDPHRRPCAAEVAAEFTRGDFTDRDALKAFGDACDVVTYEFENLPVEPLDVLGAKLRPGTTSLAVAQDRAEEKRFLDRIGAGVAPWRTIDGVEDVRAALDALGAPILLKTRRLGYDGKGQAWVHDASEADAAWQSIGGQPAVAEARVAFDAEFSLIVARTADGATALFGPIENRHEGGILRRSTVPASKGIEPLGDEARRTAIAIAHDLDHVGVLTVEFFAVGERALVNEIAPRVHNSGHWTIEGAFTSQFEQHVRAICGLPLGDPGLIAGGATMDNLIGADVDRWAELLAEPGAALHLYGKGEARPGRKMGHATRVGSPRT